MRLYLRIKRLLAVYIEVDKDLGKIPILEYTDMQGELIIQLPYITVILSPPQILRMEEQRFTSGHKHDKRNKGILAPPARATKN